MKAADVPVVKPVNLAVVNLKATWRSVEAASSRHQPHRRYESSVLATIAHTGDMNRQCLVRGECFSRRLRSIPERSGVEAISYFWVMAG
jgi:hypothetical protein